MKRKRYSVVNIRAGNGNSTRVEDLTESRRSSVFQSDNSLLYKNVLESSDGYQARYTSSVSYLKPLPSSTIQIYNNTFDTKSKTKFS